MFAQNLRTN